MKPVRLTAIVVHYSDGTSAALSETATVQLVSAVTIADCFVRPERYRGGRDTAPLFALALHGSAFAEVRDAVRLDDTYEFLQSPEGQAELAEAQRQLERTTVRRQVRLLRNGEEEEGP